MNKPKVIDMSGAAIIARLDKIEARQRDYGMHDPGCSVRQHEKHYSRFPDYSPSGAKPRCGCWLSED